MTAMGARGVMVTGARGYLGGRLCKSIAARDNLRLVGTSRSAKLPANWPGGDFVRLDLAAGREALREAMIGLDAVIHLAAPDQVSSARDPQGALLATAGGTAALLEAAVAAGVRRFVYASTAHVYGASPAGRIDERTPPRPRHPYAIAHRAAEDFVLAARDEGRIEGVVARLSNGIGAPLSAEVDSWNTVGNDLCRQAITEGALRLASSGEQWRDFITLSDVATAMLHLLDLPASRIEDGLFNLGSGASLRIVDIAGLVADRAERLLGRRPPIRRAEGAPVPPFAYGVDKLLSTGLRLERDLAGEIDATLRLCAASFLVAGAPSLATAGT